MNKCACGFDHDKLNVSIERGVLVRHARGSEHRLKKPAAWAYHKAFLDWHWNVGDFDRLRIADAETGEVFSLSFPKFMAKSVIIDRGRGQQRAVVISEWERTRTRTAAHASVTDGAPTQTRSAHVAQMQLFEIAARPE